MPFSPAFKASLVAAVLVILTHVTQLGAAPVDLRYANRQPLHHAGNDSGPGASGHYVQSTGLDLNKPYSPSGWNSPTRTPSINAEAAKLRQGEDSSWTPNASDRAPSESSAAAHAGEKMVSAPFSVNPEDVRSWSEKDPSASLDSPQWLSLSGKDRAAALEAFGPKVFSKESLRHLPHLWEEDFEAERDPRSLKFRRAGELHRRLIAEYLRIRLEHQLRRKVEINWDADVYPASKEILKRTRGMAHWHGPPLPSALEKVTHDPAQAFILGGFEIHLFSTSNVPRKHLFENARKNDKAAALNVVGIGLDKEGNPTKKRLYFGQVSIRQRDESEQGETQLGSTSQHSTA